MAEMATAIVERGVTIPAVAPLRQSLVIRYWVPEQISNGAGKSRWREIKARKAARTMGWACARQAEWKRIDTKVRLDITYVFPVNRRRDVDNLYARSVGLVNGLKEWFVDDSTEWLDLHVDAIVERGVKETRVQLEAM